MPCVTNRILEVSQGKAEIMQLEERKLGTQEKMREIETNAIQAAGKPEPEKPAADAPVDLSNKLV